VALGKAAFADHFFTEWALPRAAFGKAFADGKGAFAKCGRHSAKTTDPVVFEINFIRTNRKKNSSSNTNSIFYSFGKL
jgi:hypothetical protein